MLEKVDLNRKMGKKEYKEWMDDLQPKLSYLQRACKEQKIPVMIVFEGFGAAGKGTLINKIIEPLDPRGFSVYATAVETKEEKMHPFLWRFWTKTPSKGRMHIFDRSWYRRVITEQMDAPMDQKRLDAAYQQILSFEEQLSADGTLIIKFFLHISADEQEKRLKKLERSPETKWRVTKADWKHFKQYKAYLPMYDHMLEQTDMSWAPWHVIEATDREYAAVKVMTIVAGMIEERLNEENEKESRSYMAERSQEELPGTEETMRTTVLDGVDVSLTMTKEDYKKRLSVLQKELTRLQNEMYLKRIPVVVALEGWEGRCDQAFDRASGSARIRGGSDGGTE